MQIPDHLRPDLLSTAADEMHRQVWGGEPLASCTTDFSARFTAALADAVDSILAEVGPDDETKTRLAAADGFLTAAGWKAEPPSHH